MLVNLFVGPVMVVVGILIPRNRVSLFRWSVSQQRDLFGDKVGDAQQRASSPFWMGFAGFGAIVIGCAMVAFGVASFFR